MSEYLLTVPGEKRSRYGDGYDDVIVGAPFYDTGQTYEGRAFVYFGSASGLSATAHWTAASNQAGALFGDSVGTAGDVNGDGYDDGIGGANLYGYENEGAAVVFTAARRRRRRGNRLV